MMCDDEQKKVVEYFLSNEIRPDNCVVLLGPAGTGKSNVIKDIRRCVKQSKEIGYLAVLATSGVAAASIGKGARTVHSFARIGIFNPPQSPQAYTKCILTSRFLLKRASEIRYIIIDEISMADALVLIKLDILMRIAKKRLNISFGGCRVMLVGDVLQLPPVFKGETLPHPWGGMFWFEAFSLMNVKAKIFQLSKIHRQGDDQEFADALSQARIGRVTSKALMVLRRAEKTVFPDDKVEPTSVMMTNNRVNEENARRIRNGVTVSELVVLKPHWLLVKKLSMTEYEVFDMKDSCNVYEEVKSSFIENPNHSALFGRLTLRTGAQVMFRHNISTELGVNNGTRAVVIGWVEYDYRHGDYCLVNVESDCYADSPVGLGRPIPVVFIPVTGKMFAVQLFCKILGRVRCCGDMNTIVLLMIRCVPLALAWAITAHRAQGLPIDRMSVCIPSTQKFPPSLLYVILSRCRKLSHVRVEGTIKSSMFWIHPTVARALEWLDKKGFMTDLCFPTDQSREIENSQFVDCLKLARRI